MLKVPRVTINGAILSLVTTRPLINPTSSPMAMAITTPRKTISHTERLRTLELFITQAAPMPETAKMPPTDKSSPPVMITKVSPTPTRTYSVA